MGPWYRIMTPRPQARRRLLILPHAAGGPAYYRDWVRDVPADCELVVMQLPGREARWGEPPLTRMDSLMATLQRELAALWSLPVSLFGHSLGAIIAYELARRFPVEQLILAGARAPLVPHDHSPLHPLPAPALRRVLRRLGGSPNEVLANDEMFGLLLPVMRADLELLETYVHRPGPALDIPLRVFGGFLDERTPLIDLLPWRVCTRGETQIEARSGGHFFGQSAARMLLTSLSPASAQEGPAQSADLHIIRLDRDPHIVSACRGWLDDSERQRADRFVRPEDGRRFTVAHGSLRLTLGRKLGIAPGEVRFTSRPGGKPELHRDHHSDIRFNLSHSDSLALLLIADGREVGVDIERIREDVDHISLADRFLSPAESLGVSGASDETRPARFFACWTGREAYSKARGRGLSLPLDEYAIRLDDGGHPCGVVDRTLPGTARKWHVAGLNVAEGFAAAIAGEEAILRLRLFDDTVEW